MSAALPAGLRDRVLASAVQERRAGRPLPEPPVISGVEAFRRAADALSRLLAALDDEQWRRPALRGLAVQGLVGHLTGVERDVQHALADDDRVACVDHVASTQPAAEAEGGRRPEQTRRAWRDAVDATVLLATAAGPQRVVAVHGMQLPLGKLLVVRAFELWTHENDIRAAAGLPSSVPDPAVLALMTDLAAGFLPVGMARLGAEDIAVDLHLVLTGPGGGTWDVALGEGSRAGVLIVADAVAFCRLVADRVTPAALDPHVQGPAGTADVVLRAAAALALD